MEVDERTKPKGYDINEEQYSDSNDGKNPEINAGMFINVPIMYVDKGVEQGQPFEYETLAHLASDGQARDHTKTTHARVPK